MPDKRFEIDDKVWWIDMDYQPVRATVTKVSEMGCVLLVEKMRTIQFARHREVFHSEKVAWAAAYAKLTTAICNKREQLDALFALRETLRQRLYPTPKGTNEFG